MQIVSVGRVAHPDAPEQKLAGTVSPQIYFLSHIDIDEQLPYFSPSMPLLQSRPKEGNSALYLEPLDT